MTLELKHQHDSDKHFVISLTYLDYRIKIRYLQTDYKSHRQTLDFKREDLCITTKNSPGCPELVCHLGATPKDDFFGVSMEQLFLNTRQIKPFQKELKHAEEILNEAKRLLKQFYPNLF